MHHVQHDWISLPANRDIQDAWRPRRKHQAPATTSTDVMTVTLALCPWRPALARRLARFLTR
eukprot:365219-Chlamydomonas_euryale.AAC.44